MRKGGVREGNVGTLTDAPGARPGSLIKACAASHSRWWYRTRPRQDAVVAGEWVEASVES